MAVTGFLIAGICAFSCLPAHAAQQEAWRKRIDKDGLIVHTRRVEGSPILEYKGHMTVKVPMEQVIALYEDVQQLPKWFYQCVDAKVLNAPDAMHKVIYFALHLPWPVAERDVVFEQDKAVDAATHAVSYTFTVLPDQLPPKAGRIRMVALKSLWQFTPLPDGRTEVYFQQHSDPGGSIPTFVVNKLVVDIPFNSLKNFRRLLTGNK